MESKHAITACCEAVVVWENPENDIEGSWHCSDCGQRVEPCRVCGEEMPLKALTEVGHYDVPHQHYRMYFYACTGGCDKLCSCGYTQSNCQCPETY
jgi:hypothetical protein